MKKMVPVWWLLLLLGVCRGQVDLTLAPLEKGKYVVEAVVAIIQETCIFEDDKLLLRRMAYVESKDGTETFTFRSGFYGGIWQLSESKYDSTKQVSPAVLGRVQAVWGLDWISTTWTDLLKPFHSGLAMRLYLQYLKESAGITIPPALYHQGLYWSTRITSVNSNLFHYISLSLKIPSVCKVVADIAFLVDGSGSITPSNYAKVKDFIKKVLRDVNVGADAALHTRVSCSVFSDSVSSQFGFDHCSSLACYENKVASLVHPKQSTNTASGLEYMRDNTFLASKGARPTTPDIVVVLTDGQSNSYSSTVASAASLLSTGVRVFAVGVGSNLNFGELKAMASDPDCTHLSLLRSFDDFDALVKQIEKRVCNVPTEIKGIISTELSDVAKYFFYRLTAQCKILEITSTEGVAMVYYAYNYQPSPVRYDGSLQLVPNDPRYIYATKDSGTAYITVVSKRKLKLSLQFFSTSCQCPGCLEPVIFAQNFKECTEKNYNNTYEVEEDPDDINSISDYNCADRNPCSPLLSPTKFYYVHADTKKYVQCGQWGQCYVRACPSYLRWSDKILNCVR